MPSAQQAENQDSQFGRRGAATSGDALSCRDESGEDAGNAHRPREPISCQSQAKDSHWVAMQLGMMPQLCVRHCFECPGKI